MPERVRFEDLVIVLPGIGGSMLYDGVEPLWDPSLGLAGALLHDDAKRIDRLAEDPGLLDDPSYESAIQPVGLIERETTLPGLASVNIYKPLRRALGGNLELYLGDPRVDGLPANYFEFAYDWRRDIRVSANRLAALVKRELPKWNGWFSPGGDAKTVLVAHSMGGLVAKYYLDVLGGWETCRALITFGTPYRGAPVAATYLANGYQKFGVSFDGLTRLIRSFTSVYQLLPRYQIVQDARPGADPDTPLLRVAELLDDTDDYIGGLCVGRAKRAREDFHKKLVSPRSVLARWRPLAGFGHRTVQRAVFDGSQLTAPPFWKNTLPSAQALGVNELVRQELNSGDGTVPALSATPLELADVGLWAWENSTHSSIHCMDDVLEKLLRTLVTLPGKGTSHLEGPAGDAEGPEQGTASKTPPQGPTLDLDVDAVFARDEPVEIRCGVAGAATAGPATIEITGREAADGHVSRLSTVDADGEGYRWLSDDKPLPAGSYTVAVRVPSLGLAASDVFEVC